MKQFGNLYSQYYDLLYNDKNYKGEVEYVIKLIKENNPQTKSLLDLGCGTGKHAEMFCENDYIVHGIDLSEDMLKIAKIKIKNKEILSYIIDHLNYYDLKNILISTGFKHNAFKTFFSKK